MWMEYMRVALQDLPEQVLERPPGLVNVRIDPQTGHLARTDNPDAIFEVFQSGTAPVAGEDSAGADIFLGEEELRPSTEQLF
jgi:penicillin-binding protein 1A